MNKKVSIIVPVYNAEKFIDKCVKSLLGQTYQNIEIILVDDGSPDTCPQLCDKYAREDNRVRVIHQKNRGASGARENGLKIASGEYVSFVDPDDWLELSAIGEMAEAAENEGADIVICDWKTFTGNEETGKVQTQTLDNNKSMEQIREEFLMDLHPNFMCNKLYNIDLLKNIKFPGNIIFEDLYLNAEIFCRSDKFFYIPKPFYCYRIHASSANTSDKLKRKYGLFIAWQEHERVCGKYNLTRPLQYSRLRTQQAAISLLTLDAAASFLDREQLKDVRQYLDESLTRPAKNLTFKHKFEWWALRNMPTVAKLFGRLSLWADERKQKRKFG